MMVSNHSELKIVDWVYSEGEVRYSFEIFASLQNKSVTLMFLPANLGISETVGYLFEIHSYTIAPTNNYPAYYYSP